MRTYDDQKKNCFQGSKEGMHYHLRTVPDVLPEMQGLLNLRGVRESAVF